MKNISTLLLIGLLTITFVGKTKTYHSIEDVIVEDNNLGLSRLTQWAPDNHWVLIIVNKNLNNSHQMLELLNVTNLNLDKTVILVIGNLTHEETFEQYKKKLNVNAWIDLKESKILKQLNLSATPVVLGIVNKEINWKINGLPSKIDFNGTISQINKWSIK